MGAPVLAFTRVPSASRRGALFSAIIWGLETGVRIRWVPLMVAMITFLVIRPPDDVTEFWASRFIPWT